MKSMYVRTRRRNMVVVISLALVVAPIRLHGFMVYNSPRKGGTAILWPTYSVLNNRISSEEVNNRLAKQLEKLRVKDRQSKALRPEDLKIIFEDEHIIVVDKPAGVLSVASDDSVPSLARAVYEHCQCGLKIDQMVVHRLGMDTSGLIVFAKTMDAVREMNALFRSRRITRQYEALVCGHMAADQGWIGLPLMRDFEHPPFMRISTAEQQAALAELDAEIVGKKLLEAPKASLTHYQVVQRESVGAGYNDDDNSGLPVTRIRLTSISGRTHQLNVHCAAFGHPIVQDSVYGLGGDAAPNGGLDAETLQDVAASSRVSPDIQQQITTATQGMNMCVHAQLIKFRHPVTREELEFSSLSPF